MEKVNMNLAECKTAKEVLAAIDEWAATQPDYYETDKLWKVLTALRGPDDQDETKKWNTTAVIRFNSVPNLTERIGAIMRNDFVKDYRKTLEVGHFSTHARAAFEALDPEW